MGRKVEGGGRRVTGSLFLEELVFVGGSCSVSWHYGAPRDPNGDRPQSDGLGPLVRLRRDSGDVPGMPNLSPRLRRPRDKVTQQDQIRRLSREKGVGRKDVTGEHRRDNKKFLSGADNYGERG